MQASYICSRCKDEWEFFPEDYENQNQYPTQCPHCTMPISQLFGDVLKEEGLWEAIRKVWGRIV